MTEDVEGERVDSFVKAAGALFSSPVKDGEVAADMTLNMVLNIGVDYRYHSRHNGHNGTCQRFA